METAALKNELHAYIDTLPEQSLQALKPIFSLLVEEYWKPVIEPASPEEIPLIDEGMAEYRADPSSFIPLEDIK